MKGGCGLYRDISNRGGKKWWHRLQNEFSWIFERMPAGFAGGFYLKRQD